jgi:dipeptidase
MKRRFLSLLIASALVFIFSGKQVSACTNYLITKGASVDGSTMISYAADSHVLYGELYHWPAGIYPEGTMMDVYEWDTGKWLGKIKQAAKTYNVVGNMNENQVAIGETTYGGREELVDSTAIIDYGSLIYLTLQRATSARDAIRIMNQLVNEYGYYSSGESFSISDKDEVWILEMIGNGPGKKGALWVALLIPDGYVSGHANQARITTFPLADGKTSITSKEIDKIVNPSVTCVYASDVISFAKENNYYKGPDKDFSFSDVYAPVNFGGARFCEIRVWTMFNQVSGGMNNYWDYVKGEIEHPVPHVEGQPLTPENFAANRMPLWVKPTKKVSVHDMMQFMRDHLENTELDMSKDAGAGSFGLPYRWRPLTWEVDSVTYCNERATATQQTGFSFVAQARNWLPDAIGAIIWWGVDDASGTVYMPMYASITNIPHNFEVGNGAMMEWSETSGFWIFNQLQNFVYTRYNFIHPDVQAVQQKLETEFINFTPAVDAAAKSLYDSGKEMAVAYLTDYSNGVGDRVFKTWKNLYSEMFMKYMDGNIKTRNEVPAGYLYVTPNVKQPGYSAEEYKAIADETGDKLKVKGSAH